MTFYHILNNPYVAEKEIAKRFRSLYRHTVFIIKYKISFENMHIVTYTYYSKVIIQNLYKEYLKRMLYKGIQKRWIRF